MVKELAPKKQDEMMELFSRFYDEFFTGFATSIDTLADFQDKFKDSYNGLRDFGKDPNAIESLIGRLDFDKRGIVLNLLLKASDFSKRTALLYESSASEKRQLADDFRNFVKYYKESLEKVKKEAESKKEK